MERIDSVGAVLKRSLTLVIAVICGFCFDFLADMGLNMVLDHDTDGMLFTVVLMILFMMAVYVCNSIHDHESLKIIKKRWCANTLFSAMVVSVMDLLLRQTESVAISNEKAVTYEFVYAFAVVLAINLYQRNYYLLFPKEERMQILAKRNVHHERGYFLVTSVKKEKGLWHCTGNLIGKLRSFENLYLYQGGETVCAVKSVRMIRGKEENGEANDGQKITLVVRSRNEIRKYAVLSSVRVAWKEKPENHTENPRLIGLFSSFSEFYHDSEYLLALTDSIFHCHFLVPVRCQSMEKGMITQVLPPDTPISIPSVSRNGKENEKILPIFTDWNEMMLWKGFTDASDSATIVAGYDKLSDLYDGNFTGIVVNPFSSPSFFIGEDLLGLLKDLRKNEE